MMQVVVTPGDHNDEALFHNRLSCAAANPYLVLAATVAAGMDGIKSNIALLPPPWSLKEDSKCAQRTPQNLSKALHALEADPCTSDSLGSAFMRAFMRLKRAELDFLGCPDDPGATQRENERTIYMTYL